MAITKTPEDAEARKFYDNSRLRHKMSFKEYYQKLYDNKFSDRHGETDMSNKFLPFIVENSTPLHILKTLLSRSKGMNEVLVASILYLVLEEDIKKLRKLVKEMPEMPLEKVYEELLTKFPYHRISDEVLRTFQLVAKFFPAGGDHWSDDLAEYDDKDVMMFFCALAYADKDMSDYTPYSFNRLMQHDSDEVLENITDFVRFEDKGEKIKFQSLTSLRAFILYMAFFRDTAYPDEPPGSYCAILEEKS